MSKILQFLKEMDAKQASDLFVSAGKSPKMRRFGKIEDLQKDVISSEEIYNFIESSFSTEILAKFKKSLDVDVGLSVSIDERFRLNLSFRQGLPSIVARKVPSGALPFKQLILPEHLGNLVEHKRGLILVTGATGSGKSSTMAALLHHINTTSSKHVVTIEDPIEFIHKDDQSLISQREIGADTENYSQALRHVVRQNPDVIFIGEMRDAETMQTALSAAMTGHLVISTIHTADSLQTIDRIINYFPESMRSQIATDLSLTLIATISQRLLPLKDGSGLIPSLEILQNTPLVANIIGNRRLEELPEALRSGDAQNMISFNRSLHQLVKDGKVDEKTAIMAASNKEEMKLLIEGMETGIDSLRFTGATKEKYLANMKHLLLNALENNASDLLLNVGSPPNLRIQGVLWEVDIPKLTAADSSKLLFSILNARQRATFEREKEIDFALSIALDEKDKTKQQRFRVNGFYQKGAISCAIRIINQKISTVEELGLPKIIVQLAQRMQGLLLVTGPTGHGKSTTLSCLIDLINQSRSCHIITVEDPIEFVHTNKKAIIEQREVYADTLSFTNALKYILRQDPDVILIGEMRDPETISAAITAAETGHLVLATLHTNDVSQSVDRIIDTFPSHQQNQIRTQLASSLLGVVSQRLLPKVNSDERIAAFEIMVGTVGIKAMIRDGRTHQILSHIEASAKDGMITMDRSLLNLYEKNLITRDTAKIMAHDHNLL